MGILAAAAPWLLRAASFVVTSVGVSSLIDDVFGNDEKVENNYNAPVEQTNKSNDGLSLGSILPIAVVGVGAYFLLKK